MGKGHQCGEREDRMSAAVPARTVRSAQTLELVPFAARPDIHRGAQAFGLRRRHQPGVIVLMAGKPQAESLDGVADETDRPVGADLAERFEQRGQVVTGEIGHEARQFGVPFPKITRVSGRFKSKSRFEADAGRPCPCRKLTLEYIGDAAAPPANV